MKYPQIVLDGAVVVVTGGARGIGFETARRFAAKGATVAIADLSAADAESAASRIGKGARGFKVNVAVADEVERFINGIEHNLGPIEVYVNNAGVMPVGSFFDEQSTVTEAVINVNFWAHVHSLRVVAPKMVARGRGHIVNVTSAAGRLHSAGLASYVASKHAATGLARSIREELAHSGVSITAVMPSAVRTELVSGIPFGIERLGIVSPELVARRIVGTVRFRPPVAGAPFGITPFLSLGAIVPDRVWMLGRRLTNADRTLGPIDREARMAYDSRTALVAAAFSTVQGQNTVESTESKESK